MATNKSLRLDTSTRLPLRRLRPTLSLASAVAVVLASGGLRLTAAPATFDGDAALGIAGDNVTWGSADNWTTNGVLDTLPSIVAPGDDLTFGGGTIGGIIDLGAARFANTLTFNRNYTLGLPATANTLTVATAPVSVTTGNTGTINAIYAGTAGIALTGGGTLVLNRTGNTFTGNITVDGAGTTLAFVGSGTGDQTSLGATGARSVTLTNGATISVITATANPAANTKSFVFGAGGATANVATGLTFQLDDGGQFSGAGNVTKTGNGILFLNNQAFAYTGTAVNVNAGTLRVGANAGVLGTGTVAINVANGATYDNLIGLSGTKNITVGGTGVGGAGALIASSGTGGNIGGTVTLTADTAIGGAGTLTIGGVISDGASTFNISKVGAGTTILNGTNTWDGNTTISGGALRGTAGTTLPTTGNLILNGGAFETVANYAGTLGTGAGQVQLPGGASGFGSGLAGGVNVSLNGAATQLVWGTTPNFNPSELVLSQLSALGALNFQNPIDLNGATRTFTTNAAPSAGTAATLSGVVSGTAGLTKNGAGVLVLGNAANAYTGETTVAGGVLRGTLGTSVPATGNLNLNGGVFETSVNLTANLGAAPGEVRLSGGAGGFSAFTNAISVNLNAGATVQFGGANFNPSTLIVNAASANQPLDFQNDLDLNGATRTLAGNGTGTAVGTISGDIVNTGAAAGITINGSGILALTGTNTYTGTTTLTGGTLRVSDAAQLGAATAPVTFGGGTLQVTGTTLNNFGARTVTYGTAPAIDIMDAGNTFTLPNAPLLTTGTLTKNGAGTLLLGVGATDNILTQLNVNGGVLDLGNSDLQVNNGGATTIRTVTGSGTINASGTGAIELTVSDGDAGAANGTTLTINAPIKGAFRYENFVVTNGTGVTVLANPNNTYSGGTAINSSVVSVSVINDTGTPGNLGTGSTINITNAGSTLRYTGTGETNNRIIALTGTTLGGIIEMAGTGTFRMNGGVTAPGAGSKTLTLIGSTAGIGELGGVIANNSATNTTSIVKNGTGTWRLSGVNTFTGNVTVTQGNLIITNSSALGTGTKAIALSNGTAGTPQLFLDGSAGNITLPSTFTYATSVNTTAANGAFINVAGNNTIQGTINPVSGGGDTGIIVNGGTLTISANITQAVNNAVRNLRLRGPANGSLTGTISNGVAGATIGIIQEGTGVWSITGNANTYSGPTNIPSGTLLVANSSGSATGTSAVTVSGTGTLGGTGIISGVVNVNAGGTLAPGLSPGILGVGNTTFNGGTFALEIFGTTPGNGAANHDQLNVTGTVSLTANTPLTLSLGTFDPADDGSQSFVIVNNDLADPVTGTGLFTFSGTPLADGDTFLASGQLFQIDYTAGTNNNDVALLAVPEPTSGAVLLAGLGMALGLVRRSRRRA